MRKLLAGIFGGLVMFCWSAVTHMVLPIGEAGIKVLPDEGAVVGAMKASIHEPGLYFFPGMEKAHRASKEEQAAWEAKYKAGPSGILVYQPGGSEPMSMRQLGTELGADIIAVFIALLTLGAVLTGAGRGIMLGIGIGLIAWFSISLSHWNWFGFPGAFVGGEAIDQVVGWALALFVAGGIARRGSRRSA